MSFISYVIESIEMSISIFELIVVIQDSHRQMCAENYSEEMVS